MPFVAVCKMGDIGKSAKFETGEAVDFRGVLVSVPYGVLKRERAVSIRTAVESSASHLAHSD
jgi:hypothetical protein